MLLVNEYYCFDTNNCSDLSLDFYVVNCRFIARYNTNDIVFIPASHDISVCFFKTFILFIDL